MKEYPIGTLCLIVGSVFTPRFVGRECTIAEPLRPVKVVSNDGNMHWQMDLYLCEVAGHPKLVGLKHEHLMKLDPPGDMTDDEAKKDKERPRETADAL